MLLGCIKSENKAVVQHGIDASGVDARLFWKTCTKESVTQSRVEPIPINSDQQKVGPFVFNLKKACEKEKQEMN